MSNPSSDLEEEKEENNSNEEEEEVSDSEEEEEEVGFFTRCARKLRAIIVAPFENFLLMASTEVTEDVDPVEERR